MAAQNMTPHPLPPHHTPLTLFTPASTAACLTASSSASVSAAHHWFGHTIHTSHTVHTCIHGCPPDGLQLRLRVSGELVDGDNYGDAICPGILDMALQVAAAAAHLRGGGREE